MAEAETQPAVYEEVEEHPPEQVEEAGVQQPSETVDQVLEEAVERAVDETADKVTEEASELEPEPEPKPEPEPEPEPEQLHTDSVAPMQELEAKEAVEEPVQETVIQESTPTTTVDEPAHETIIEESIEDMDEPAHYAMVEEADPELIDEGPVEETTVEETAEEAAPEAIVEEPAQETGTEEIKDQSPVASAAELEDAPAEIDDVYSVVEQPTIIVTRATVPTSSEQESIVEQYTNTEPVSRSLSSSSTATTVTVIRDGQSNTTTAPFIRREKTVTFARSTKPRIIDRGRNTFIRDPLLRILLGRRIAGAIGPDIRTMLEYGAGKGMSGEVGAIAA